MKIGPFDLARKVLIIAEIGNNHEGSLKTAVQMLHEAARAGADVVKFQTIVPEYLVSADQKERIALLKKFQLSQENFSQLESEARRLQVGFLSTAFDLESVDFLNDLNFAFKIASSDIDFFPLIERVASLGKPLIVSLGTANVGDFLKVKEIIEKIWHTKRVSPGLVAMHCVSKYPTPDEEADLGRIHKICGMGVIPGYSDHTLGIDACVIAAALGARVIEKHFTLDKNFSEFRDHKISADPLEFRQMVDRIRQAENLMRPSELSTGREAFQSLRRSVAAGRDILAGEILRKEDIIWLRPGTGMPPGGEKELLGKKIVRSIKCGEILQKENLEQ